MCEPILATVLKMRPHYSQSSRENATPSSGTLPLACYKEVPPPPPRDERQMYTSPDQTNWQFCRDNGLQPTITRHALHPFIDALSKSHWVYLNWILGVCCSAFCYVLLLPRSFYVTLRDAWRGIFLMLLTFPSGHRSRSKLRSTL